jgi:hypothetical protein
MIVPTIKQKVFFDFLKENGFEIVSTDFWDKYNRVMFKKDGHTFPLVVKEKYYFVEVCHICNDFGVEPPEDHKKVYEQYKHYIDNVKNKENKKPD